MLIALIGESCTGKSTLAARIKYALGAEVISGKDYLRMARSQSEATALFKQKLAAAVSGDDIVYVIAEPEHLALLPEGAVRVLVRADLDTIKERFATRMHGYLPEPVAKMLERKHGMFDDGSYDFRFDGASDDADGLVEALKAWQCHDKGFNL